MIKPQKKLVLSLVLVFVMLILAKFIFDSKDLHYKVEVFRIEDGWGYDIMFNGNPIIHQAYMPSVNGNITFENRRLARKTGYLVVKRLKKKVSPRISPKDLINLEKD